MITFDPEERVLRELMSLPKVETKRVYHRVNCTGIVRGQFIDQYGRKITICGKHAFEYTIYIESITHVVVTEYFANGTEARKRFNDLKRVRK